jgi:hypothetical protein
MFVIAFLLLHRNGRPAINTGVNMLMVNGHTPIVAALAVLPLLLLW